MNKTGINLNLEAIIPNIDLLDGHAQEVLWRIIADEKLHKVVYLLREELSIPPEKGRLDSKHEREVDERERQKLLLQHSKQLTQSYNEAIAGSKKETSLREGVLRMLENKPNELMMVTGTSWLPSKHSTIIREKVINTFDYLGDVWLDFFIEFVNYGLTKRTLELAPRHTYKTRMRERLLKEGFDPKKKLRLFQDESNEISKRVGGAAATWDKSNNKIRIEEGTPAENEAIKPTLAKFRKAKKESEEAESRGFQKHSLPLNIWIREAILLGNKETNTAVMAYVESKYDEYIGRTQGQTKHHLSPDAMNSRIAEVKKDLGIK